MAELLIEIGTEEIPARMLNKAATDLAAAVSALLSESNLKFTPLEGHGAPRQITIFSREVQERQEDRMETVLGPPARIAYDDQGNPTKALLGFLKKNPGLELENLTRIEQKKGEVVAGEVNFKGRDTSAILADALPEILNRMHFAKNMRWRDCPTAFVRPVRGILALFGGRMIPFTFCDVYAGENTFGHRFHGEQSFPVRTIDQYIEKKQRQGIVVRHNDRVKALQSQMDTHLAELGGRLVPDDSLLQETADLVEAPFIVVGSFDPKFLDVPREVLVSSLREHQKSFCIEDSDGKLMPYFFSVASVPADTMGLIKKGNEWVLNARLYDAKFFWESDRKKSFDDLREKLKDVIFHTELGSYFEKTERLEALARYAAEKLALPQAETEGLAFAARHAKTDLVSELVFEFAELQGNVGGLLLEKQDQPENVWRGVYEHYLPSSMDGDLPESLNAAIISLVDKLDTLVGCFSVGLIPTGTKDPYALRRAAQGIVRILIEKQLDLPIEELAAQAMAAYAETRKLPESLAQDLRSFFDDRIRYFLKRTGFSHDLVEAVVARDTNHVDQTLKRAEAIARQQSKGNFRGLALNIKRMNNVVADEIDKLPEFNAGLLQETPEVVLWERYKALRPQIEEAFHAKRYADAMDLMTELADPVEAYFGTDGVYINAEDSRIRLNRKSMIDQMRQTLSLVADLSRLEAR